MRENDIGEFGIRVFTVKIYTYFVIEQLVTLVWSLVSSISYIHLLII